MREGVGSELSSFRFLRPAVFGASYLGGQVAALFASAGIRVRLYDRPLAGDANALARGVIEELMWQKPLPFAGQEAVSLIDARNYGDDWALLKDHDLIIECHEGDLAMRRGMLTRLAPALSKEVVLMTLADGLPLEAFARALPAGLRPRFCGAHFYRPSRFMRLMELYAGVRTEARVLDVVRGFFTQVLGREVLQVADSPNYVGNRLLVFLIMASFYHAQRLGLSLEQLEYLTMFPEFAENKGIVSRVRFLGAMRVREIFVRVAVADRARFGVLLEQCEMLQAFLACLSEGRVAKVGASGVAFDAQLQGAIDRRDWLALGRLNSPAARFLYAFWRDVWQYMAWVAQETGLAGADLDRALRYGINWPYNFYAWFLAFSPKVVIETTKEDAKKGVVEYAVGDFWRKARRQTEQERKAEASLWFADSQLLFKEAVGSRCWLYQQSIVIWQPLASVAVFDVQLLAELLQACEYAKGKRAALLIYHHGESFGVARNWREFCQQKDGLWQAEQDALEAVLLALRMLPSPVLVSLSGKVYDAGFAVMMQADCVLCDTEVSWQLSTIGQGLISFGGVWFEWLRRLPAVDEATRLAQIHGVLARMAMMGSVSDVHTARQLGLLRSGDGFMLTRAMLEQKTAAIAQSWVHYQGAKAVRYGQKGLSKVQRAKLAEKAQELSHGRERYLIMLGLLGEQVAGRALSLRLFLQDEWRAFNQLCMQEDENGG